MRLPSPLLSALGVALLCGAVSGAAMAGPSAKDKAEAKQLVVKGKAALKQKQWADAETALRRADELDPSAQNKVDLARALSEQGKLVEASKVLHEVTETPSAKTPAAKKAGGSAKKLLGEIESRIPSIAVTVSGPPAGKARALIDGQAIDGSSEVPIDPGEHVVTAEAEGFYKGEKRVKLAEGAHEKVTITLTREVADPEAPVAATSEEKPSSSSGGSKAPALIAFGLGAVGIGVGAAFGVMAFNEESKASDFKADYERTGSQQAKNDFESTLSTSKTNGTISTIAFVVGGVGVATGVILLITSSGSSTDASTPGDADKVSVRPFIGPGQAGMVGVF